MLNDPEIWRPLPEFDGYEVSSLGRVRHGARILSPCLQGRDRRRPNGGYLVVHIKGKGRFVHVLVASAFIGPKPPGMQVNHKDGIKLNLNYENLEYVTPSENAKHAYAMGLYVRAKKLTPERAQELVTAYKNGAFVRDLAKQFDVSKPLVQRTLKAAGLRSHGEKTVTARMITEIRAKYIPKKVPLQTLAVEYGIAMRTVQNIVKKVGSYAS